MHWDDVKLLEGERIDDLECAGYGIIQSERHFRFSMDPVLLAHFATVRRGDRVADLCSGSGVIPLLLSAHTEAAHITAVEIQEYFCDMARRSIAMNHQEERIDVRCINLKDAPKDLGYGAYHVVTCNPPYLPTGRGKMSDDLSLRLCRHEVEADLDDIMNVAYALLKNGGRFAMVHLADRLGEIVTSMEAKRLAVKRLRPIQPRADKPANLILIEGVKEGKPGIQWLSALNVYEGKDYSDEILRIYHRE